MTSANSLFDFSLMARDGAKGPDLKSLQLGHVSSRCMRSGRISMRPDEEMSVTQACGIPWMQGGQTFHSVPTSCWH